MAFGGTALVLSLGQKRARITGLTLANGATGTIGLFGDSGADCQLPAKFPLTPDSGSKLVGVTTAANGTGSTKVALTMSDLVWVNLNCGDALTTPIPLITKGGTPFRITVTAGAVGMAASTEFDISYEGSFER